MGLKVKSLLSGKLCVRLVIIGIFVYQICDQTVHYLEYEVINGLRFDRNSSHWFYRSALTICLDPREHLFWPKRAQWHKLYTRLQLYIDTECSYYVSPPFANSPC